MQKVKVTQVRSQIGRTDKQKLTLRALGLRRIGQSNELPYNDAVKGMINKVSFLIKTEEVK